LNDLNRAHKPSAAPRRSVRRSPREPAPRSAAASDALVHRIGMAIDAGAILMTIAFVVALTLI
jgi:hypothetical protein